MLCNGTSQHSHSLDSVAVETLRKDTFDMTHEHSNTVANQKLLGTLATMSL